MCVFIYLVIELLYMLCYNRSNRLPVFSQNFYNREVQSGLNLTQGWVLKVSRNSNFALFKSNFPILINVNSLDRE